MTKCQTIVETSDQWIQERTGIRQRHIAADGELTSDLATHAARAILADAGIAAEDVDLLVLATTTPDKTFPATATAVQANLGMGPGAAFDVQAVCSGFLFALATADSMLKTGSVQDSAGDWRRDLYPYSRLVGSRHLRAVWRWRRRAWS